MDVIIGGKIYCPLCGKEFQKKLLPPTKPGEPPQTIYFCLHCMISINALDKALGRWDELEKPVCPMCHKPMPIFFRAIDNFTRCDCKKCKFISAVGAEEFLPPAEKIDKSFSEKGDDNNAKNK